MHHLLTGLGCHWRTAALDTRANGSALLARWCAAATVSPLPQAYQPSHASDVLLFCCGEYADIVVVHPLTLEVVYWLSSKLSSNWVTSLHVFRPKGVSG